VSHSVYAFIYMDMDPEKTSQASHPSQALRRKGSQRHTLRHARHSVTQG